MASINGIEVKAVKRFAGHDGMPCYQGNVYYQGKKLGFWSQDYRGGIDDDYDFNTSILDEIVELYKNSKYVKPELRKYTTLDYVLAQIVLMQETEARYKKYVKKGYTAMCEITDDYNCFYTAIRTTETNKEKIKKLLSKSIEQAKAQCLKNQEIQVNIYTSLEDFNIKLGTSKPSTTETKARAKSKPSTTRTKAMSPSEAKKYVLDLKLQMGKEKRINCADAGTVIKLVEDEYASRDNNLRLYLEGSKLGTQYVTPRYKVYCVKYYKDVDR